MATPFARGRHGGRAGGRGAGGAASAVVAPGDLLVLSFPNFTAPGGDYMKPVRVGADGNIPLPLVPNLIKVAGLSLAEAEKAVSGAVKELKLSADPMVTIDRMERAAAASVALGPIVAGDVIRLSVNDLFGPGVERVRHLHVSPDGHISLPLLGQTKVAGMTEAQAEAAVAKAYVDAKMMSAVIVSVLRVKLPPGPEPIPESLQSSTNRK